MARWKWSRPSSTPSTSVDPGRLCQPGTGGLVPLTTVAMLAVHQWKKTMTLTELRYIVTLAQEQHFGRAAERCHVSQPTLSVGVKKLEDELGVLIFERSKSAVRLTPVGE